MAARLFLAVILAACVACRSGKIPCPKPQNKWGSSIFGKKQPTYTVNAKDPGDPRNAINNIHTKVSRITPHKVTLPAETIEDWDCPKPGSKKAASKVAKENARKNMKRFKSHYKNIEGSDSVQTMIPMSPMEN